MSQPLVSIIVPCYNAEHWLEATLLSSLGQTWPRKEIVVVDDGSSDGSLAVARRFETQGVRVALQANRGASAARNHGLRLATGDFVQFLDADDLLSPDKISAQVELLLKSPVASVASCRWARFRDEPATASFDSGQIFRDFSPAREFLLHHSNTSDMMQPSAWLTPRAVVERSGPWDETLSLNDDGEYFCRVLLKASAVRFSPLGSVYYRSDVAGSLSRRRSRAAMVSLHRSIELYAAHLIGAEDSARVRAALANHWKNVQRELYPEASDLSDDAGRRSLAFGGATAPFSFGPRIRIVAALLGWKIARRLQRLRQD